MNFFLFFLIFCCIYQIAYQLLLVVTIIKHKKSSNIGSKNTKSVSVIICAKNEIENLQKNLPFILNQKYADFEVILVDDGSDESLKITHDRLTIITLTKAEKIGFGKKYALQKGIEFASKDLILLTDADCVPTSENWITEMACLINEKHKIVLGISPYKYENTFLNAMINYETTQTAMQYIGFALLGKPYMCVGRNVCYDANLLKSKKWTAKELAISSGDDDLTIQTLATKENTTVCLSYDSFTISEAKKTWKSWFIQKKRHAESGFLYKFSDKLLLGSYIFTKNIFYFYFLFNLSLFSKINLLHLYIVIITMVITSIAIMLLHKTLNLQQRWNYNFILDPIYGIMPFVTGLLNALKSDRKWK